MKLISVVGGHGKTFLMNLKIKGIKKKGGGFKGMKLSTFSDRSWLTPKVY